VVALEPRHERGQAAQRGEARLHDGAAPVARPELREGQSGAALDARGMLHERHVDGRACEEAGGEQGNELGDRHVTAARSAHWRAAAGP
jgi:hypothetical protein